MRFKVLYSIAVATDLAANLNTYLHTYPPKHILHFALSFRSILWPFEVSVRSSIIGYICR